MKGHAVRPANLSKKRLWHRSFLVNFAKLFKNTYFYRTPPVTASRELNLDCKINKFKRQHNFTSWFIFSCNQTSANVIELLSSSCVNCFRGKIKPKRFAKILQILNPSMFRSYSNYFKPAKMICLN